jgi:hypothetical protein
MLYAAHRPVLGALSAGVTQPEHEEEQPPSRAEVRTRHGRVQRARMELTALMSSSFDDGSPANEFKVLKA